VAQIRRRRSLTQQELAERAGLSRNGLAQIEQGLRPGTQVTTLYALVAALNVPIRSLFDTETEDGTVEENHALLVPLRRLLSPVMQLDGSVDEAALTFPALRQRVLDCTADFDHGRYTTPAADIPSLIHSLNAMVGQHENEAKADAYRLLAHTYTIAAQLLIQLRDESLAYMAISRAIDAADRADDPVLRVSPIAYLSWAYVRQQRFDDGERVAAVAAASIEPSITSATPEHLAVWGRLLRNAANAAVYNNRPDTANDLLSLAHTSAVRIGTTRMDYGKYWGVFGPTNITITRAEHALIQGDAELALRLGQGIQRANTLPLDEWTRHLLTMAEAQTSTRDYGTAIGTMKRIRTIAPEWIKNHRVAHDVARRLLDATDIRRARSSGLAELVGFMGVEP
jgi:transcriptional regulator with XRE-family HTH domain